jgi:YjbE family integral membrane protein
VSELFSIEAFTAFASVVMIDLVLAGDNAIVVALAAAGLPRERRRKVILFGIAAATGLRIAFAVVTTQLLQIIGLLLAGGILLLWVSWKFWRELAAERRRHRSGAIKAEPGIGPNGTAGLGPALKRENEAAAPPPQKTVGQAILQIVFADISMSLDNVLAVAGAALEHPAVLIFGLALSVALMGAAAAAIATLLERHRWIAYLGLLIITYVALRMIYDGALDILAHAQA